MLSKDVCKRPSNNCAEKKMSHLLRSQEFTSLFHRNNYLNVIFRIISLVKNEHFYMQTSLIKETSHTSVSSRIFIAF